MADMIAAGAAYLAARLKSAASSSVAYVRGTSSGVVRATVAKSMFQTADANGIVESWESRDFIVAVADLPFGEPRRGDKIVETLNGNNVTYEVTSPRGVPIFHYGDSFRNTVRVHTVATAETSTIGTNYLARYWGAYSGATITNAQILSLLSSDLGGSKAQARTINASGAFIYFVLPTSFGTPTFSINGFGNSAWETTQRAITTGGISYTIYRSTYQVTGSVNVALT